MPPDIDRDLTTGGDAIALAVGEAHVWIADLDAIGDLRGLLSPQERVRAQRLVRAQDARRWARSRGLLRLLLGEYLRAGPASLRFDTGEHGKPRLVGGDPRLRFNVSHSGAIGLYAFALEVEVGVDVERRRPGLDVLAVAERAFDADAVARLRAIEDTQAREREFLRRWVRHEAELKCLGTGLRASEAADLARPPWVRELDLGARWSAAGAVAAVAAAAPVPGELLCRQWPA